MNPFAIELDTIAVLQQKALGGKGLAIASDTGDRLDSMQMFGMPEGFLSFDEQGTALIGVVNAALVVPVVVFPVPRGYDGLIQRIHCSFTAGGFVDGSGDLIWRIWADGRPIRNYSNILFEQGSAQTPKTISGIRIFSGQVIMLSVTHAANNAYGPTDSTTASLAGYYYPRKGE